MTNGVYIFKAANPDFYIELRIAPWRSYVYIREYTAVLTKPWPAADGIYSGPKSRCQVFNGRDLTAWFELYADLDDPLTRKAYFMLKDGFAQ